MLLLLSISGIGIEAGRFFKLGIRPNGGLFSCQRFSADIMTSLRILSSVSLLALAAGCMNHPPRTTTYTAVPVYRDDLISQPAYPPPVSMAQPLTQQQMLDDQDLVTSVRNQFDRYGDLAGIAPNINIEARGGEVTLSGSVPSPKERDMILAMVKNSPGVVQVNSLLRVAEAGQMQPTGRPSANRPAATESPNDYFNLHVQGLTETDRTLAQKILSGLRTDEALATSVPRVSIDVADGQVTLRGIVQNEQQKQTILSTVQDAVGADNVRNELKVQHLQP